MAVEGVVAGVGGENSVKIHDNGFVLTKEKGKRRKERRKRREASPGRELEKRKDREKIEKREGKR